MKEKIYIRDKRSPIAKSESVSKVMSANKAKNTKPEITLRKYLWKKGLRGYRLNYKRVAGRPDITYVKSRLAIFVNGCFWHRCPSCNLSLPKTNTAFWEEKFERNIERDKLKTQALIQLGWKVIVIWECSIRDFIDETLINVTNSLM